VTMPKATKLIRTLSPNNRRPFIVLEVARIVAPF
jgi:hypothetical protein